MTRLLLWIHSTLGQGGLQCHSRQTEGCTWVPHKGSSNSDMEIPSPRRLSRIRVFAILKRMASLNPSLVGTHLPWCWYFYTKLWILGLRQEIKWMGAEINNWSSHIVRPRLLDWLVSFHFTDCLDSKLNLSGCWHLYSVCLGASNWGFSSRAQSLKTTPRGEAALTMAATLCGRGWTPL